MRRPLDLSVHDPLTPIYNGLCAEYRRQFRTLPGDRGGEEPPRFDAFGLGSPGRRYPAVLPALPPGGSDREGGPDRRGGR